MRGGGNAYRSTVSFSLFSYFPLGFVLAPKRILATTPFLSGISETPTGSIMINGLRWMEILPLSLSLSLSFSVLVSRWIGGFLPGRSFCSSGRMEGVNRERWAGLMDRCFSRRNESLIGVITAPLFRSFPSLPSIVSAGG